MYTYRCFFLFRVNTFVESSVGCDVGYLLSLSRFYRNKYVQFCYISAFLLISYVVFRICERCCWINLLAGHLLALLRFQSSQCKQLSTFSNENNRALFTEHCTYLEWLPQLRPVTRFGFGLILSVWLYY
jgi:hypothetical protein